MIPGYNHNIHYKSQVFHIQTEDSGLDNPHIITHLFIGGNIIKTRKTSYADIVSVDGDRRRELLVELMQGQHKSMLKDLIKGRCDDAIESRSANAATLDGPAPLNVEAGGQQRASMGFATGIHRMPENAPVARGSAPPPLPKPATAVPAPGERVSPVSAFFGDAPVAPGNENIIEAATLERAFDARDDAAVDSIFGEDLISEKSLDEVILSYLAEDMQE